jgi:GNAT superfamily N-acetyltransferase
MTIIRAAAPDDAPVLAHLLRQLGYDTPPADIPSRLAAIAGEGGVAVVAEDGDGHVVALGTGSRHATLHAGAQVAYITALVVDENARGAGAGRALVAALERWAVHHGCTRIAVTSAEHRADAHAFYPRCGFPYTGRRFSKTLAPPAT